MNYFISEVVICACTKEMKIITPFPCFARLLLIYLGAKPWRIGPFAFNSVFPNYCHVTYLNESLAFLRGYVNVYVSE